MTSSQKDDFITKISSLFEPKNSTSLINNNKKTNLTNKKSTNNEFLGESNKFNNYSNILSNNSQKVSNNSQKLSNNSQNLLNIDDNLSNKTKSIKQMSKDLSISSKKTTSNINTKKVSDQNIDNDSLQQNDNESSTIKSLISTDSNLLKKTLEKVSNIAGFNWKTIFLWIGIVILLTFFGLNIFSTLGNVSDLIANIFKPILSIFGLATIDVTSKTLDLATDGTKGLANTTTNIIDGTLDFLNNTSQSGLSLLKNNLNNNNNHDNNNNDNIDSDKHTKSSKFKNTLGITDTYNSKDIDKLSNFIDTNFNNINKFNSHDNNSCKKNCLTKCNNETGNKNCKSHCDKYCDEVIEEPDPVIDTSRIQSNKASGKSGFCYIGEENGIRSCVRVDEHDVCNSGKIYQTKAICQNPRLRK